MADIGYKRKFTHDNWVDNEDVVQADGERGFNPKFHALEDEFDAISGAFATVDSEFKKIQRLEFVTSQPPITLAPATVSEEFQVETYDRSTLPVNVEQVYFPIIIPVTPNKVGIVPTFLYRQLPNNKIAVTITFFNPMSAEVKFAFRVLNLAVQK